MERRPYVNAYRDRHGTARYTFRRSGEQSRPLPGQPGEPAFEEAYQAAVSGKPRVVKRAVVYQRTEPQTLAAAWKLHTASIDFLSLKASSRYKQTLFAERFLASPIAAGSKTTFGAMPIASMKRRDVRDILAIRHETPHSAEYLLRLIRVMCKVAIEEEWMEADPTHLVRFRPALKGHRGWTDPELVAFERRWPIGETERLGFALALYTGQRRGDLAAMTWEAYADGAIAVKQEKTGTPLIIPVHPHLAQILDGLETREGPIIVSKHGRRFTTESFGNTMADAIRAAGLTGCTLHGLRKSAGRCLAEAGATTRQIMAVLGHRNLSEAERYTRDADQKRLAQQGMKAWQAPSHLKLVASK